MIAKINLDGEDRWVIVLPQKTSFVSSKDLSKLSIVINSGIANVAHNVPVPTLRAAVDLAMAVKELPPNIRQLPQLALTN